MQRLIFFFCHPKFMRKVFISLILLLIFSRLHSQQKPALRSFNIELGKNGMVTNLYYDQVIKNKNYGFRLGAGSNFARYLREVTGTVGGYYLVGKRSNFFETGIDLAYLSIEKNSDDQVANNFLKPNKPISGFYSTINLGYRMVGKKFLFRIGIAPGMVKDEFIPGAFTSIGIFF
jgi:hypothetical protein